MTLLTASISSLESEKYLYRLYEYSQLNKLPIALWRLPYKNAKHLILSQKIQKQSINLENIPPGFLVSPFVNPDLQQILFLPADLHYQTDQGFSLAENPFLKAQDLDKIPKNLSFDPHKKSTYQDISSLSQKSYEDLVTKGIAAIKQGEFQKLVLSRKKEIVFDQILHPLAIFNRLCELYPNAFVSLIKLPNQSYWLGATPELLMSIDQNQVFKTVALAGTQKYNPEVPISEAVWAQKDIEEQALVSRFIVNCFKHIRLRDFKEEGPKTVAAGNLLHLKTDFLIKMNEVDFKNLGTTLLQLLHPTSAVCGMPKDKAREFILAHENYDRNLYSGFLGPIHIQNETNLFVNLRCMQLEDNKATFYAGAGIMADSNPEKEWLETEMKMQTILKAFL